MIENMSFLKTLRLGLAFLWASLFLWPQVLKFFNRYMTVTRPLRLKSTQALHVGIMGFCLGER